MGERKWTHVDLGDLVPDEIPDAVGFLNDNVVTPFATLLTTLIQLLELAKLGLLLYTDPIIAVLAAAITAIEALIERFKTTIGVHALFVPVLPTAGVAPIYVPAYDSWVNWEDEADDADLFALDPGAVPLFQANPPVKIGAGGNWGFFTEYADSLEDEGDDARPNYRDDHFVCGLTLIFGAKSLGALIVSAFRLFKLLQSLSPFPMDRYILPVPQNLRVATVTPFPAKAAAEVNEITEFFGGAGDYEPSDTCVVLTWDLPKIIDVRDFFPDVNVEITSLSLYARAGASFAATTSGESLAKYEIRREENIPSLLLKHYVSKLDPDIEYFFAVGYGVELTETREVLDRDGLPTFDENGEAITETIVTGVDHYDTSNIIRVKLSELGPVQSKLPQSELPNWVALQHPMAMFPPLEAALELLKDLLRTVKDSLLSTAVDDFTEFLDDLKEYSAFYLERVQALEETLTLLEEVLRALDAEIYGYGFSGVGGNSLLKSEVNSALFDPATRNRPPFESGGDFVAGIVLVGGAPSLEPVKTLQEFLELLFGDMFNWIEGKLPTRSLPDVPDVPSLSEAVESINALVAEAEEAQAIQTRYEAEETGEISDTADPVDAGLAAATETGAADDCAS